MSWDPFTAFENSKPKQKDRIKKEEPILFQEENNMATIIKANSMSFYIPESKSKRKGKIKKEEPILFLEETTMATDADVSRYYELKGRLGQSYGIWNASVQMETFKQSSPQEKDNIRQIVKNELPNLEEQITARIKSIQHKCSSGHREAVEFKKKKQEEKEKANSMATDADVFRYFEVTERLEKVSIFKLMCSHNGNQISRAQQQMESFRQMAPQDRDNLRRAYKIELPKLEEKLKENYERNKQKEKEQKEAAKKRQTEMDAIFKAQKESRRVAQEKLNIKKEEEDFERRFKEEEKEKRYQEYKKNKYGLGLDTGSSEALPVAIAVPVPTLVVESSSFALKNKLWVTSS